MHIQSCSGSVIPVQIEQSSWDMMFNASVEVQNVRDYNMKKIMQEALERVRWPDLNLNNLVPEQVKLPEQHRQPRRPMKNRFRPFSEVFAEQNNLSVARFATHRDTTEERVLVD